MKRLLMIISLFLVVGCYLACSQKYYENSFFSYEVLKEELVPELTIPFANNLLFCEKYGANENRVYVLSDKQTPEEYFYEVIKYIQSLSFIHQGTVYKTKDEYPLLGQTPSYYYSSTLELPSISLENYFFKEENAYIYVYSNGDVKTGNDGTEEYIDQTHMIKVFKRSGTYQNDNYVFDYDYYIEFANNPSVWFEKESENQNNNTNQTGTYKLIIKDIGNHIYDKPNEEILFILSGSKIVLHSYPIMDADLAMYINGKYHGIQNYIKVNNEYIWEYNFEMPKEDVTVEFKVESIEYLDVKSILNIPQLSQDDVIKVRCEKGAIGVAPGTFTEIAYSENVDDINDVLSMLEMMVYEDKGEDWQVTGGGYIEYTVYTQNNNYTIEITNGYITSNQKHYKFNSRYAIFENPNIIAHSFITYIDNFSAYDLTGEKIGEYSNFSDYEFIEYPYEVIPENINFGYIETELGRFYIHSNNIFYKENANEHIYYLIVGEKNFGDIFNINEK